MLTIINFRFVWHLSFCYVVSSNDIGVNIIIVVTATDMRNCVTYVLYCYKLASAFITLVLYYFSARWASIRFYQPRRVNFVNTYTGSESIGSERGGG